MGGSRDDIGGRGKMEKWVWKIHRIDGIKGNAATGPEEVSSGGHQRWGPAGGITREQIRRLCRARGSGGDAESRETPRSTEGETKCCPKQRRGRSLADGGPGDGARCRGRERRRTAEKEGSWARSVWGYFSVEKQEKLITGNTRRVVTAPASEKTS